MPRTLVCALNIRTCITSHSFAMHSTFAPLSSRNAIRRTHHLFHTNSHNHNTLATNFIPANRTLHTNKSPSSEAGRTWRLAAGALARLDLRQNKRVVIVASILLIGAKLAGLSVPFLFKTAIDALAVTTTTAATPIVFAGTVLVGYGVARFASFLLQEIRNALFASVSQDAMRTAHRSALARLIAADPQFHLTAQTGALVRDMDRGVRAIQQMVTSIVLHIVPTALEIALVCTLLWSMYGWPYALTTFVAMTAYTAFTVWQTSRRISIRRALNNADSLAASIATDALLNYSQVQLSLTQRQEASRFDSALKLYEAAAIKTANSLAFLNAGQNAIVSAALTAVMLMAAYQVPATMTIGDLVMLNGLVFQLSMPLNFLGSVYRDLRQALLDFDKLHSLEAPSRLISLADMPDIVIESGTIELRNLSCHRDGREMVSDISLKIAGGSSVALVGASGSGKSTILRLISGLAIPTNGQVLVDGQDISQHNLDSLRTQLGVYMQEASLLNLTVGENIQYGNNESSNNQMQLAAKMACVDKDIESWPHGYDTRAGERGGTVSGGERQRICLARLFLSSMESKKKIWVMDEPTSALDAASEQVVLDNLNSLRGTRIFITHRLASIMDVDQIHVLSNGRVVESGTHSELLTLDGIYAELWHSQEK